MTLKIAGNWWLAVPVAVGLAGCGDSGNATNTDSGTMTQGTVDPTLTGTATTPTTSNSATDTDSGGSMSNSATMSTTSVPTTSTTDATATLTAGPTTDTTTTTTSDTTTTGTTTNTDTTGNTTGGVCQPGDPGNPGMAEKSYIFIPSQDLDDVAKVNTQTLIEEARYKIGPGGESASRTAVSADGRFVVVNNRQTGRSTMLAANVADCVDTNGNGMIDTSQSSADVRPWGQDECILWQIQWPYGGAWDDGPRGVTWTPGTWDTNVCAYVDPKVWIGYMAADQTSVHLVRVAVNGTVEETIAVPGWNGSGFAPYGAALDPDFKPWFSSLRGEFVRVNTDVNPITVDRFTPPGNVQSYGFTVDPDGDPWFGGNCGPITRFDPDTMQFIAIPGTEGGCWRGVTADKNFTWVANNQPCALAQVDRTTNTLVAQHNTNPCSTAIGLSVDIEDYVWLVDQGGWAWKIDPDNVAGMQQVIVPGSHYVYSDMTGGQLKSVIPM
ncbi:lyase [Nannocystis radixulma]|uniref:Lyase n=1 Tax=Nannocystis radixulma TaxID=2995305 RepID=A0ABT5BK04_9BACT|nr:lyase [Nannocystis radixulma]MDC0674480.1 lyase [Nannocystis radixulma]